MVNKHTINYHPSPSQLISRIHIQFFPKPLYSAMVAETFQIYSVKITANTFVSQKIESVYSCPQEKLTPGILSLSSRQMGIAHRPPYSVF